MTKTNPHTARLARSTQLARQNYWAARADRNDRRAAILARGLAVAERHLLASVGGSKEAARAAEVAYIESTQPR